MFLKWFNRLILLVYALLIIVPLYFVFVSSFKTSSNFFISPFSWPDPFTWDNLTGMFRNQPMWQYFGNSLVVTLGTVAIELLLSSMIAYAIVRWGGSVGKIVFCFIRGWADRSFPSEHAADLFPDAYAWMVGQSDWTHCSISGDVNAGLRIYADGLHAYAECGNTGSGQYGWSKRVEALHTNCTAAGSSFAGGNSYVPARYGVE